MFLCVLATLIVLSGHKAAISEDPCSIEFLREQDYIRDGYCCAKNVDNWLQSETGFLKVGGKSQALRLRQVYVIQQDTKEQLLFENTAVWNQVCRRWKAAAVCVHALMPDCDINIAYRVLRNRTEFYWRYEQTVRIYGVNAFYDRVCSDGRLKPDLAALIKKPSVNTTCFKSSERKSFTACFQRLANELKFHQIEISTLYKTEKEYFDRLARGTLSCMRTVIFNSACNRDTKKLLMQIARLHMPAVFNVSNMKIDDIPNYVFTAEKRCTVGIYGDPHLKVCWDEHLQTCSIPGQRLYLMNTVLEIYGWNKEVPRNTATNCKELRMVFKSYDGAVMLGEYKATKSILPSTFIGDLTKLGSGYNEVIIRSAANDKKVITHKGLGLLIVVRRWADNYFFTLRMAENAINESTGVLSTGCLRDEIIRRGPWIGQDGLQPSRVLRKRREAASKCIVACKDIKGKEFKEICEFDCTVTGETQYANITRDAIRDIEEVLKEDENLRQNAAPVTSVGCSNTRTYSRTTFILVTFLLLPLLKRE